MTGASWAGFLKSRVKPAQMKWSGLDDFLEEKIGKKVTKQEILDHLDQNDVQVEQVILGTERDLSDPKIAKDIAILKEAGYPVRYNNEERVDFGDVEETGEPMGAMDLPPGPARLAAENVEQFMQQGPTRPKFGPSTHPTMSLPGGENYREVLLKLPVKNRIGEYEARPLYPPMATDQQWGIFLKGRDENLLGSPTEKTLAEGIAKKWTELKAGAPEPAKFTGGHYPDPDVLAQLRLTSRTSSDGKRVLFVEEIQSDWAQKGRREGFSKEASLPEGYSIRRVETDDFVNFPLEEVGIKKGDWIAIVDDEWSGFYAPKGMDSTLAVSHMVNQAVEAGVEAETGVKSAIPPAPFVTSTGDWTALAVKRILRMAAEEGYDRVAWTTGEQQAERYDLSKHVDELLWNKDLGVLIGSKNGNEVLKKTGVTEKNLADYVGKDAADKLLKDKSQEAELESAKKLSTQADEALRKREEELGVWTDDITHRFDDLSYEQQNELNRLQNEISASAYHVERVSNNQARRILRGQDLKIGGEGMSGFYGEADGFVHNTEGKVALDDKGKPRVAIIPKTVAEVGKKWGLKTGETTIDTATAEMRGRSGPNKEFRYQMLTKLEGQKPEYLIKDTKTGAELGPYPGANARQKEFNRLEFGDTSPTVHSIDITPEMREGVMREGLPQFKTEGAGEKALAPEVVTLEQVRANLPEALQPKLKQDGENFVIATPRGEIRIQPTGMIEMDWHALEVGHGEEAVAGARAGAKRVTGMTVPVDGGQLIQIVNEGVLPHEIGHVFMDHFTTPREQALIEAAFAKAGGKGDGRSPGEEFADGFSDWFKHDRDQREGETLIQRVYRRIYEFFQGIYETFKPSIEGLYRKAARGKPFEREPVAAPGMEREPAYKIEDQPFNAPRLVPPKQHTYPKKAETELSAYSVANAESVTSPPRLAPAGENMLARPAIREPDTMPAPSLKAAERIATDEALPGIETSAAEPPAREYKVSPKSMSDTEIMRETIKYFGTKLGGADLAHIAGVPEGSKIFVKAFPTRSHIEVYGDIWDKNPKKGQIGEMIRVFHPSNPDKSGPYIENYVFNLYKTGTGQGARIFSDQVERAAAAGFKFIRTYAGKGEEDEAEPGQSEYNGFYTWARLGYDGKVRGPEGDVMVSELMKTKEGRDWWRVNGHAFEAKFDLTPGSLSRQVLSEYMKLKAEKEAARAGEEPGAGGPEPGGRGALGPGVGSGSRGRAEEEGQEAP